MALKMSAAVRNAAATRAAILCAARQRFRSEGYDEVGMRDIARDVGCDPALVSRYFGSKEELFGQVLSACGDNGACMMEVPREQFGAHYARQLVFEPNDCDGMEIVLIMLRASGSAKAAEMVRRATVDEFLKPFAQWLGGEQAEARDRGRRLDDGIGSRRCGHGCRRLGRRGCGLGVDLGRRCRQRKDIGQRLAVDLAQQLAGLQAVLAVVGLPQGIVERVVRGDGDHRSEHLLGAHLHVVRGVRDDRGAQHARVVEQRRDVARKRRTWQGARGD